MGGRELHPKAKVLTDESLLPRKPKKDESNEKQENKKVFLKIWANPGLFFVYFRPFHITNQLQIEKA